jgi:hypothetical protein
MHFPDRRLWAGLCRSALAALVLLAGGEALLADPINYEITFSAPPGDSLGVLPSGSFTYDPSVGFSNFLVDWADNTFDITSSANEPALASDPATGCDSAASDPQYGFLLITQSATGCAAQYGWLGIYDAEEFDLDLVLEVEITPTEIAQDEIVAQVTSPAAPSPSFNETIGGSWTVTEESSSTPEPGSVWLMLFGTLAVAAISIFRRRRV